MDTGNSSTNFNDTNAVPSSSSSSSSSSSPTINTRLEFIGGIVCFVAGVVLITASIVVFSYTFHKKRKMRKKEEEASRHSLDLREREGRGNPSFELDEDTHVGLPLPTRSDIFSLSRSNYDVSFQLSMQQTHSKRQDSNSSSDNEVGTVSLHRTSPLAAIYLIYDELNKTHNSTIAQEAHS